MTKSHWLKAALLAAPATAIFASQAFAQTAAPPPPPPSEAPGVTSLEEIVVTARRRNESLQTVPVAETALTATALAERHIQNVKELSVATPSLTTTSVFSTTHVNFSMRGRAAENNQFGNSQVVEVYFADVPQMAAPISQFYDISSVQVLRGPQGTLFGRASNGGAVLFAAARPESEFGGYATVQVGNLNDREVSGAVNLPIMKDVLNVRIAGSSIRRDGYTKVLNRNNYDLDNRHSDAFRVYASFTPTSWLSDDFVFDNIDVDQHLGSTILLAARTGTTANFLLNPAYPGFLLFLQEHPDLAALPGVSGGLQTTLAAAKALGPRKLYLDQRASNLIYKDYVNVFSNTTKAEFMGITLKNIFGYQRQALKQGYAADGIALPLLGGYDATDFVPQSAALKRHMVTDEFQVLGSVFNNRVDWLVAGFIQDLKDEQPGNTLLGSAVPVTGSAASYVPVHYHKKSKALFTHETIRITSRLSLSGGFRRTWDDIVGVQSAVFIPLDHGGYQRAPAVCIGTAIPADFSLPQCTGATSVLHSTGDNWIVDADYKISDSLFVYASGSHGFRPGGVNATATIPALRNFGTESLIQEEGGIKFEHAFDTVATRLNFAIYHQDVTDAQVGYIVFNPFRKTTEGVTLNAPKTSVLGAEIEGELVLNRYVRISGFADYIKAKYETFGIPNFVVDPTAPGGVRVSSVTDVSSNPLPNVPKFHVGATVRVTLPTPEAWGDISVDATYFHQARFVFGADFRNEPEGVAPSYDLVNAGMEWNHVFGQPVTLTAFVKNLTDATYIVGGTALEQQLGMTNAVYSEPRTFGVALTYHFGGGR